MTIDSQNTLHQGWVTPEELLKRLAFSQLERDLGVSGESLPSSSLPVYDVFTSAIRSILNRSGLSAEEIPSLFDRCVEQIISPSQLPKSLTNWYTVLKALGALPEEIPLPRGNIHQILEGECPIYGNSCKIKDTHSLYLIPSGTLNEFEQRVCDYGRNFFQGENALKFDWFGDQERLEHANILNNHPQWVLISNDVLPGSLCQNYAKQIQMVEALNAKSFTKYDVPRVREAAAAIFLDKMGRNKMYYPRGNEQNGWHSIYTRVMETARDSQLVVGGLSPKGLIVDNDVGAFPYTVGMTVVHRL